MSEPLPCFWGTLTAGEAIDADDVDSVGMKQMLRLATGSIMAIVVSL